MFDMQCALQWLKDRVEDSCKPRTTGSKRKTSCSSYTVEQVCINVHVFCMQGFIHNFFLEGGGGNPRGFPPPPPPLCMNPGMSVGLCMCVCMSVCVCVFVYVCIA